MVDTMLTTGWESALDTRDTMLRAYLLHWAELCATFVRAGGGRVHYGEAFAAADLRVASGYWNAATLLAPPSSWDATVAEIEEFFAGGSGEAMLWSAFPTPDLRSRGWRLSGHPPLLIRPPLRVLPADREPGDVRRVASPADLVHWERVAIEGYPLPELQHAPTGALAPPALLADPRLSFWLAGEHDSPVAAAAGFHSHDIGSLAFGVTLPNARHRGHWRRLAVERLATAPDCWFAGVFSDYSRPGAESLGFVPVVRLTLWILERPHTTS